jgi:Fic family protein
MLLALHRVALEGISSYAGNFRPAGVEIAGSKHEPPGAHMVPECVEDLCDYVNSNWNRRAIHLAAYVMWRLNWIHPFDDGNGRTSRAASYMVLCARAGHWLPGSDTIPEQISRNKGPYYEALEAADTAWDEGRLDVSAMEKLLGEMLAHQLVDFHGMVTGVSGEGQK